jgi:hypothetical protein
MLDVRGGASRLLFPGAVTLSGEPLDRLQGELSPDRLQDDGL